MAQKKSKKIPSTQEHLNIAEIKQGVVVLKDGGLRLVLLASSVNFALKSEKEQNGIIIGFQNFLNALNFPIQILMQSRKLDLDKYLKKLEVRLKEETNDLIQLQINDYISYINKLITVANIMEKKFFIVIPFTPPKVQARSFFDKLFNPGKITSPKISTEEFAKYKEQMVQRANVVASELGSLGVKVALLNTQQIIETLYSSYNLVEAETQKLVDISKLDDPVIGGKIITERKEE